MSFGLRAIAFCFSFARELVEVPPPPKKFPRRMSLMPVEPEPTPKATKPTAKTSARKTKTHFACLRRRGKNIACSYAGAARLRFFGGSLGR